MVAGQSWGGNVVLTLAAEHGGVAGLALVDGGWISLGQRYPTFEQCWAELAPPVPQGLTTAQLRERFQGWLTDFPPEGVEAQLANLTEDSDGHVVARLTREHHKAILRSLCEPTTRDHCSPGLRCLPSSRSRWPTRRATAKGRTPPPRCCPTRPPPCTSVPTTTCTPSTRGGWPTTCWPSPPAPSRWRS